jgi:hypothetical protein
MTIHLETIEAGLAPGGVYIRICSEHDLITEVALTGEASANLDEAIAAVAESNAHKTIPYLERGETVWTFFYDGDSGACMGTSITEP